MKVPRLGHQLLRRVGKMGRSPRREQPGITVTRTWSKLPQGLCGLGDPTFLPNRLPLVTLLLGQEAKTRSKRFCCQETPGWVGSRLWQAAWMGGTEERRQVAMPWQVGLAQPTLFSWGSVLGCPQDCRSPGTRWI